MDLHPIIVHFPVALFTLYGLFELLRFKKLTSLNEWAVTKAVLVCFGVLSSFVALATGDLAGESFENGRLGLLAETHSSLAVITVVFYAIVLAITLGGLIRRYHLTIPNLLQPLITLLDKLYRQSWLMVILALIGLALITVTGALGGALAFGPGVDPLATFFFNALVR